MSSLFLTKASSRTTEVFTCCNMNASLSLSTPYAYVYTFPFFLVLTSQLDGFPLHSQWFPAHFCIHMTCLVMAFTVLMIHDLSPEVSTSNGTSLSKSVSTRPGNNCLLTLWDRTFFLQNWDHNAYVFLWIIIYFVKLRCYLHSKMYPFCCAGLVSFDKCI